MGWRSDSLRIVKMAHTFVLASLYGESITKSVLEGMSLGTPAVITNIPGNREMIVDGESGYVVPKQDPPAMAAALLKMYQNPAQCKTMGKAARQRIANVFNSDRTIEGYYRVYKELSAN